MRFTHLLVHFPHTSSGGAAQTAGPYIDNERKLQAELREVKDEKAKIKSEMRELLAPLKPRHPLTDFE